MTERPSESYAEYRTNHKEPRFTDWLREHSEPAWTEMLNHQFTKEMADGTIEKGAFERYLVHERAFVETAASVLGYAVGNARTLTEMRHLSEVLDALLTDQLEYFGRAFEAHDVPSERWKDPDLPPEASQLQDVVMRAATANGFEEVLAPMAAAEWLYLTWSQVATDGETGKPFIDEWIELHVTESFEAQSVWLRDRLDHYGPQLSPYRQRRVRYFFTRTVEAEIAFHDAVYLDS